VGRQHLEHRVAGLQAQIHLGALLQLPQLVEAEVDAGMVVLAALLVVLVALAVAAVLLVLLVEQEHLGKVLLAAQALLIRQVAVVAQVQ